MGYNQVEARTPFSFLELASFFMVWYNQDINIISEKGIICFYQI